MCNRGSCRLLATCVNLPHLDEVRSTIRDGKVVLAEWRWRYRVGRSTAIGGGGQEQLLSYSSCLAIECESGNIARYICRPGACCCEKILGRCGAAVDARNGNEHLISPIGGRVGES